VISSDRFAAIIPSGGSGGQPLLFVSEIFRKIGDGSPADRYPFHFHIEGRPMKAVALAGGEGSRLRPLTLSVPKPMLPVANQPVLHHLLTLLRRHGIQEVIVVLQYNADQVETAFGDGADLGLKIRYLIEKTPLGTAGCIKPAEEWLSDEPFLVISGSALTDADLGRWLDSHRSRQADLTLARMESAESGLHAEADSEGKIVRFSREASASSFPVNEGVFCVSPSVLRAMESGVAYDWSEDLLPSLLSEGQSLYAQPLDGYWNSLESLDAYRRAQADALNGTAKIDLPGKRAASPAGSGEYYADESARVDAGARIRGPVLIGAGAIIHPGATVEERSIIGDHAVIEPGARIVSSVVGEGVFVGANAEIAGAILCRNSMAGTGSRIEEGAILGERSQALPESRLPPGVKVWPDKVVDSGVRLAGDLIVGTQGSGSMFDEGAVRGVPNVEITPKFVEKLASAYASTLPSGARVIVGRDSHPTCRMLKRALLAGLMSSGIHVMDIHAAPEPLSRFLTRESIAQGGVHLHMSASHLSMVTLDFYDSDGISLSKSVQRKIENLFYREDSRRAEIMDVGQTDLLNEATDLYRYGMQKFVRPNLLTGSQPKIVLDCAYGTVSAIAPTLLGELGCRPVSVNAYPDPAAEPRAPEEKAQSLRDLSAMVPTLSARLGALLDEDSASLHVADDKGRILTEPELLLAFAELVFRTEPGATIAAPGIAPSELEEIAARGGGRVVRTRNSQRDLAVSALKAKAVLAGDMTGRFILPQFLGAADGLAALVALLERLVQADVKLSDIVASLPPLHLDHITVPCSWERKGEIIRRLGELAASLDSDLTEGVCIRYPEGWVRILPDATAPLFHLHVQANSPYHLKTLLGQWQARLEELEAQTSA
jgi:mannose-1-phosphate guanylyltransferase/phosphomannomutase